MFITGIDMFDDGRIVLADQSSNLRLVIMNQEGEFINSIPLEDTCYDVAVMDKDTVATTLVKERKVVIVDVNSSEVQRTNATVLLVQVNNWSSVSSTIAFIFLIFLVMRCQCCHTAKYSNEVYSTDFDGKVLWKFDCQKSDCPTGITNDAS
ncbi:unnamed protein product [Mytilus coruscus]|uniref:Uncharacterized protein n=1 Tax=Mytilus coruscus TaxID=42192 RepID=A0A6J8EX51_MYTCO|nr:unnamed protein product [Mytilus coruscus]